MSSSLEPRKVESNALNRWAREASDLLLRSPAAFLMSAAFFGGLGLFVEHSILAQAGLGLWALVHYQQAANRADRGVLHLAALPEYLLASLFETLVHLRRCTWAIAVPLSVLVLVCWMTNYNIIYQSFGDEQRLGAYDQLLGLANSQCVGMLMLICGKGFVGFAYLLGRLYNGNFVLMTSMGRRARTLNRELARVFDILVLVSVFLCTWVSPLALLVGPLAGVMVYVGFRDVYLHGTGNQQMCRTSPKSTALAGGSA